MKSLTDTDEAFPVLSVHYSGLHINQCEFQDEQDGNNGYHNILLLILTGTKSNQYVGNCADTDTVGNRVGKRHHNEG